MRSHQKREDRGEYSSSTVKNYFNKHKPAHRLSHKRCRVVMGQEVGNVLPHVSHRRGGETKGLIEATDGGAASNVPLTRPALLQSLQKNFWENEIQRVTIMFTYLLIIYLLVKHTNHDWYIWEHFLR